MLGFFVINGSVGQDAGNRKERRLQNAALAAQVNTVFKGETLRGLLLNAYAFGTMGMIAGIAAIGAFIAAALMLVLSGLGLMHARRVSPATEILSGHPGSERTPVTA
jgi:hypothetical protein